MNISRLLLAILLVGLFSLPVWASSEEPNFNADKLNNYLARLGVDYKQAGELRGAFIMMKSDGVANADRLITLIVNDPETDQLEILTYPEIDGKFLNVNRLTGAEGQRLFYERLARVNHKSFGMFFVDSDGDIGLRFTFTTENGIGFDAFRVAIENCQRVVDKFTPTIIGFMQTEIGY